MKKCKNCGKRHLSYHPCGIEKELELILPKKEVLAIRRKPVFYLFLSIFAVTVFIILSVLLLYSKETIKSERDAIAALNLTLTKRSNELNALERVLEETEGGKAALEKSRAEAESENKSLESNLAQTKRKLSNTQNDIIESTFYAERMKREAEEMQRAVAEEKQELEKKENFVVRYDELDRLIESLISSATKTLTDLENNNVEGSRANLTATQSFYYQIIDKITELRSY